MKVELLSQILVMLQNDRLTHFPPEDCQTTGLQSFHYDFWQWEHGRRVKKTTWEVFNILLSLETTHWRGSQGLGALLSLQSRSPLHHEAHSEAKSEVSAHFGFAGMSSQ